jgi:hypothetical protein
VITNGQIQKVPVRELTVGRIMRMWEVAANYYREPDSGLSDELRCSNLVYFIEDDDGAIGCFLIVDFDHHRTTLNDRYYRFTYLGLGCATSSSIVPVFRKVESDFSQQLAKGTVGVLHLTTRTPFAYHGIERAYGSDIFPTGWDHEPPESIRIVKYIREAIHHQPLVSDRDNPFLLREIKEGPFNPQEIARIGTFRGDTPISKMGVRCDGRDEVIVFHTFVV